jgi:putative FmdB family regulatory protein
MPLYDFHCEQCGHDEEMLVASDASPACPRCQCQAMTRLLSAPSTPGRTASLVAGARRMAAREGHFSNYAASERPKGTGH